jgi:hypothetical protein
MEGRSEMDEEYVYIKIKLTLKPGQTESTVQDIVSELDYEVTHKEITETEITDIFNIPSHRK